jgi:tetratricopeptide (TPR) repeat protein
VIQREGVDAQTLAATFNNRGLMMVAMELPEEALGDFDSALELSPDLIRAQVNRATTLFLLGRYAEALAAYDEILLRVSTDRHVILFNRALTRRALGDVAQASDDLTAARHLAIQIRPTQTVELPPQSDPPM